MKKSRSDMRIIIKKRKKKLIVCYKKKKINKRNKIFSIDDDRERLKKK